MVSDSRSIAVEIEQIQASAQGLREGIALILSEADGLSKATSAVLQDSWHQRELSDRLGTVVGVFRI